MLDGLDLGVEGLKARPPAPRAPRPMPSARSRMRPLAAVPGGADHLLYARAIRSPAWTASLLVELSR
ncbi:hypothetical protein ACFQX7_10105 [Luedemannella flava]